LSSEMENIFEHDTTDKSENDDFSDLNLWHQNNDYDDFKSVEYFDAYEPTENYEYSYPDYNEDVIEKKSSWEEDNKNHPNNDNVYDLSAIENETTERDTSYETTDMPTNDELDVYEDDDYKTYDYTEEIQHKTAFNFEDLDAVYHYDATLSQDPTFENEEAFENEEVILTEHGSDDYKVKEYNEMTQETQDDATNTFNAAEPKINNLKQNSENIQKVTASFPISKEQRSGGNTISYSSLPIFHCLIFTFYQLYNL